MPKPRAPSFGVSALFALALLGMACRQNEQAENLRLPAEQHLRLIDSLQPLVFPQGIAAGTDTARAWPFVRAVEDFAGAYPQHERAPALLMDAAGVANGSGWENKAVQLWGQVWRSQPEHPRAPEAMFYQGFVMDARYRDYDKAVEYYDTLIARFPESPFAAQAAPLRQIAVGAAPLPPVPGEAPK